MRTILITGVKAGSILPGRGYRKIYNGGARSDPDERIRTADGSGITERKDRLAGK